MYARGVEPKDAIHKIDVRTLKVIVFFEGKYGLCFSSFSESNKILWFVRCNRNFIVSYWKIYLSIWYTKSLNKFKTPQVFDQSDSERWKVLTQIFRNHNEQTKTAIFIKPPQVQIADFDSAPLTYENVYTRK